MSLSECHVGGGMTWQVKFPIYLTVRTDPSAVAPSRWTLWRVTDIGIVKNDRVKDEVKYEVKDRVKDEVKDRVKD